MLCQIPWESPAAVERHSRAQPGVLCPLLGLSTAQAMAAGAGGAQQHCSGAAMPSAVRGESAVDVPSPQLSEGDAALLTNSVAHESRLRVSGASGAQQHRITQNAEQPEIYGKALHPSWSVRGDQDGCHCVAPLSQSQLRYR